MHRAIAPFIALLVFVSTASGACCAAHPAAAEAPSVSSGRGREFAWAHDSVGVTAPSAKWYLAEGCTAPGFETWVLVQNPDDSPAVIDVRFLTDEGEVQGPRETIPARSRRSYNVAAYVTGYNVSTVVTSTGAPVVCERAMYGEGRTWAHDSVGVTAPSAKWYLAEGCTAPGFETWVLVQNPDDSPAVIDVRFLTDEGEVQGPRETIPARSRRSYNVADYAVTYNVSTVVTSTGAPVVCERAMYGEGRTWAHDSVGVTAPSAKWYLAEGCTAPGFETWVLVQNPGSNTAKVHIEYLTDSGSVVGPEISVGAYSRKTINAGDAVPGAWSVSSIVSSNSPVVCERAMYWEGRTWAHDSVGVTAPSAKWYLAEGCTAPGFETWVLVQNPDDSPAVIDVRFLTDEGEVQGPRETIPARSRRSYNVADYAVTYNVSTVVTSTGAPVVCERAMYGAASVEPGPTGIIAPLDGPPLYPFTRDGSIACGHWPPGSLDYPYFGAPRNGTRLHAGIDIYPAAGDGAPVRAMKSGTVIKVDTFYTRYTGEVTYAVLVDHGDFVVNYAELRPPAVGAGSVLARGDLVGLVSGTRQLHFEMYTPGTTSWLSWYGPQPANLIDPTAIMLEAFGI